MTPEKEEGGKNQNISYEIGFIQLFVQDFYNFIRSILKHVQNLQMWDIVLLVCHLPIYTDS